MSGLISRVRSFWGALRRPARLEAEMDEEMRFHIEMEAERLSRMKGLDPAEAVRQAAIAFGGLEKRKEEGRDVRGQAWVGTLSLDLTLAWRMLRRFPWLTAVGLLGIALGVAVGVGFFVAFSNVFYPELPLEEGDRVVAFENLNAETNRVTRRSLHDFVTWREEMRSVEQIAAASLNYRFLTTGDAPPQPVRSAEMTAAGFQVARVPPLMGRYLVPDDEREDAPRVAVIGYNLWQARFEGDPGVVDRSVLVGDTEHVIVGVMPRGFAFPENQELWTALRASPARIERGEGPDLYVFGRLAPGVAREQAQAELTTLGRNATDAFPEANEHLRPAIVPYTYPFDNIRRAPSFWDVAPWQMMVSLLLIAIAVNIAVLVYARTAMRQGEIAVRAALGASRRRIVGQLFIEALLLAVLGAGLGLGLAHAALHQMEAVFDPEGVAFWVNYGLQPRSIALALALAAVFAAMVGIVPGLKSTGRGLGADLRRLDSGSSVRLGGKWTALIVAQVAVIVTVLPAALYLGFDTIRMGAVRTTFPAQEFVVAPLGLAVPVHPGMDGEDYRREVSARLAVRLPELEQRLEADPAVAGVTFEGRLPGRGSLIEIEQGFGIGQVDGRSGSSIGVAVDYFELLGTRILAGRGFRSSDADGSGGGLIVNESFVRETLEGGPALGRSVRFLSQPRAGSGAEQAIPGPWLEIVGVVEDLQASAFDREWAPTFVYYAVAPGQMETVDLLVRVRGDDATALIPRLRQITAALDSDFRLGPVANLATVRNPRLLAMVAAVVLFVLVTVTLFSAAGIHALMSITITRRHREMGIRIALGARPGRVLANIFARATLQLGLGGLVGLLLGHTLLMQVTSSDLQGAFFLAVVAVLMVVVGLIATTGPVRRGLSIQPMEALKEE